MAKIDKKTTFSELLDETPEAAEVLLESGMHCVGCPMARMESLEEGALAHGLNPDELIDKIKKKVGDKKK